MKRDRYNINLYKGETFALVVALKDTTGTAIDLTGATFSAQAREKSTNNHLFSFVCTPSATPIDGTFTLSLNATTTAALTPQKNVVYDVKISWTNGTVKKYLGGEITIIDTVTV